VCNHDKWLDAVAGVICWDRRQLVDQTRERYLDNDPGFWPSHTIRLPLPEDIANMLRELRAFRPAALTLGELLFDTRNCNEIVTIFDSFLKQKEPFNHSCTSGRLSRGFGPLILKISGSDTIAAMISGAFEIAASSQLNYLCISENRIVEILDTVYAYLGCGKPVVLPELGYVGSPKRPRPDAVVQFFEKLELDYHLALDAISNRTSISDVVNSFNKMTERILAALVFMLAHRGTKLKNLTMATLGFSEFAIVSDKASAEYNATRVVPIPDLAAVLIQCHLGNIKSLATRIQNVDRRLFQTLERIHNGEAPDVPLFFYLRKTKKGYCATPIWHRQLKAAIKKYIPADVNFGRHFWMSEFAERGKDRFFIRVLMGHARRGAEPFGAAGAVAPIDAVSLVKREMDSILAELGVRPWRTLRQIRAGTEFCPLLPSQIPPLNTLQIANYVDVFNGRKKAVGMLSEPCPFDRFSGIAYKYIQHLQKKIASGATQPTPWAGVTLALMVYQCISDFAELDSMLCAVQSGIRKFGASFCLEYARPTGARIVMPLHAITMLLLDGVSGVAMPKFQLIKIEIAEWLTKIDQKSFCHDKPDTCLAKLAACVQRYCLIIFPPFLNTASNLELDAPAISSSSLARMAAGSSAARSDLWLSECRGSDSRQQPAEDQMESILRVLREFGDNEKHHGEERARRSKAIAALADWERNTFNLYPICQDMLDWAQFELGAKTSGPHRFMEVVSISNYVATLSPIFLEVPTESVQEFEIDDWIYVKEQVISTVHAVVRDQNLSKLRRFCTYLISTGVDIPKFIFMEGAEKDGVATASHRSASHYFSEAEIHQAIGLLSGIHADKPWISEELKAKFDLMSSLPLRSGELNRIRASDISKNLLLSCVTSSGFSHLKSKAARRLLPLSDELHRRLNRLADSRLHLYQKKNGNFLFLDPGTEAFQAAHHLDTAFMEALKHMTGEEAARMHSFRGSCIARMIAPQIEQIVKSIYDGKAYEPGTQKSLPAWTHIYKVARLSGHGHPLTTLRYYFAFWPVLRHEVMAKHLVSMRIDVQRLGREDIITADAMRQKVSRARKKNLAIVVSPSLLIQTALISKHAGTPDIFSAQPFELGSVQHAPKMLTKKSDPEDQVLYLMYRCTMGRTSAAEKCSIGITEARLLDCAWWATWHVEAEPEDGRLPFKENAANEKCIRSKSNLRIVARVALENATQRLRAYLDLCDQVPVNKISIVDMPILERIKQVRELMPAEFTLRIKGARGSNEKIAHALHAIDPDIVIKRPDRYVAHQYELVVTPRAQHQKTPKWDGIYTKIFMHACKARYAILNFEERQGASHV